MIKQRGFVFLSVVLAMSLVAIIAYGLNRENGMSASLLGRQSDMDRARYAAEAGLQAVNADVQSENCSGYATLSSPIADTDFGGATYSAYASASSGSPVTLTSTGSYNGTSVTLTRSNSYAYPTSTQGYTLQPSASAGIDTYLQSSSVSNFGVAGSMTVNGSRYPLIKFDLSMFPPGSIPESLNLAMWNDAWQVRANVYRMRSGWEEGTGASSPVDGANWATSNGTTPWAAAGGDFHPTSIASDSATVSWLNLDVVDIGFAWMTGRYPNDGVRLNVANTFALAQGKIFLSDNASGSERPKLVFTYWLPCGASGP